MEDTIKDKQYTFGFEEEFEKARPLVDWHGQLYFKFPKQEPKKIIEDTTTVSGVALNSGSFAYGTLRLESSDFKRDTFLGNVGDKYELQLTDSYSISQKTWPNPIKRFLCKQLLGLTWKKI